MKSLITLFCCAFIVASYFSYISQATEIFGFRLAQSWPDAFCYLRNMSCNSSKLKKVKKFTIHGLWPYDKKSTSIVNCTGPEFQPAEVKDIKTDLNNEWPDFVGRDEGFWRREWDKHGKCSNRSVKEYFETALLLKNKFDIFKTLNKSGIRPNNESYATKRVFETIKKDLKYGPELICKYTSEKNLLVEVRLCVEQKGLNFTCCKCKSKSKSKDSCFTGDKLVFIALREFRSAEISGHDEL